MAQRTNLNELSDEQLTHRLFDVEHELVTARFQHSMNTLENTAVLKTMRKDIARIKTEARRRELEQGLAKDALIRNHRSSWRTGESDASESSTEEEKGGFLQGIVDRLSSND